jgi:peptidoglycan/xylan/chitin deacetylase (PgdA/CDA1 family)
MTGEELRKQAASPAAITGIVSLAGALLLAVFSPALAVIPLVFFVLFCVVASFFSTRSFFLPVNSRGKTGKAVVALTFDDGPDPQTTLLLLDVLDKYAVKATFFVTGVRTEKYGELISAILERGHNIGNHSDTHDVFLMLRTAKRLAREVEATQFRLRSFGIFPLAFRPPVGITNPKLGPVLRQQGLFCVNFSCRAWDGGNRFVRGMARRVLRKVRSDDIIVLHDVCPSGTATTQEWLEEVTSILSGIKAKGLGVIPLAELLGKSVMVRTI